jgi:hypothetical protein
MVLHITPFPVEAAARQKNSQIKTNYFTCASYAIKAMLISFKVLIYLAAEDRHSWLNTSSGHAVKIPYFKQSMQIEMLIYVDSQWQGIHDNFRSVAALTTRHFSELIKIRHSTVKLLIKKNIYCHVVE